MPSPNHGDRRGRTIDALVLHYTGMESGEAALARLCDPQAEVSCHYLVWEDGRIDQLVAEADRAWHAGRSFWNGETDLNGVSIGIEIVNGGHDFGLPPFPARQIEAVAALAADVCRRRHVPPARVLAHSDIAPHRKRDPGERFPWQRLAMSGAGLVFGENEASEDQHGSRDTRSAQRALSAIGYDCPTTGSIDAATVAVIAAFQRRWCTHRFDGVLDEATFSAIGRRADL